MKRNVKGDNANTYILIATQAISGTTPIVSNPDPLHNFNGISFVLVTTGTVAGNWKVEAANDYAAQSGLQNRQANTGTWADVTTMCSPAIVQPSGSAKTQYTQISPFEGGAIRLTFTPTSGAGNASAYRVAKGNE